jgi:minor extracellular serine protease Vpr
VNTADENVLKDANTGACCVTDPLIIGSGRENLSQAVDAKVSLDPVSVSFNSVPSGSGQARTVSVTVTDLTGSGGTYAVSVTNPGGAPGVTFTASTSTITLAAGGSATVQVTMTSAKGATAGGHWATLRIGSVAHAALYTLVK